MRSIRTVSNEGTKSSTLRRTRNTDLRDAVGIMISDGHYTGKEIIAAVAVKMPHKQLSTIRAMISDAKNPKYNVFPDLVVEDAITGVLTFVKRTARRAPINMHPELAHGPTTTRRRTNA